MQLEKDFESELYKAYLYTTPENVYVISIISKEKYTNELFNEIVGKLTEKQCEKAINE